MEKNKKIAAVVYMLIGVVLLFLVGSGEFEFRYGPVGYIFAIGAILYGVYVLFKKSLPTTLPVDEKIKSEIMEYTEDFANSIRAEEGDTEYFYPNIPAAVKDNAVSKYGKQLAADEEIFYLYDDSAFGTGKKGIMVSDRFIYLFLDQRDGGKGKLPLNFINSVEVKEKSIANKLFLNGSNQGNVAKTNKHLKKYLDGVTAVYRKAGNAAEIKSEDQ